MTWESNGKILIQLMAVSNRFLGEVSTQSWQPTSILALCHMPSLQQTIDIHSKWTKRLETSKKFQWKTRKKAIVCKLSIFTDAKSPATRLSFAILMRAQSVREFNMFLKTFN
jgi:hypothetical protein